MRRPDPGKKMTLVEFMKAKMEIKKKIDDAIAESQGSKSVATQVKALQGRLTADQKKELQHTTNDLITQLAGNVEELTTLKDRIDKMKLQTLDKIDEEVEQRMVTLADTLELFQEQLESMNFLSGQDRQAHHRKKMHLRYHSQKLITAMVSGGMGKAHARGVAAGLQLELEALGEKIKVDKDAEFSSICVWLPPDGDAEAHTIFSKVEEFHAKNISQVDEKSKSLVSSLADNESWVGAMRRMDSEMDLFSESWGLSEQPLLLDQKGSMPWLTCFNASAWRFGASAWPLPGIGTFVQARTGGVVLQIIEVGGMTSEGIALSDVARFLDTPTGCTHYNNKCTTLPLPDKAVAWVPYGFVVSPLMTDTTPDKEKKTKKEHLAGVVWCLSFFSVKLARAVDSGPWAAILGHNRQHFTKMAGKDLWSTRAASFEAFAKMLA